MSLRILKKSEIHKAGWVLLDPWDIVRDGYVKVESGKIIDVGKGKGGLDSDFVIDHGPGVLMPALVNAHTHLELSGLKGLTDTRNGFLKWVESVIKIREHQEDKFIADAVLQGIRELSTCGVAIIGEVAGMGISRDFFLKSDLSGVWFREFLGNTPQHQLLECEKTNPHKIFSVSGHGPHTTSRKLLIQLKQAADNCGVPFTMHLAESEDELRFVTTAKGPWANFLTRRGINFSDWKLPAVSPVQFADQAGLLDEKTLAVHLVFAGRKDLHLIAEKKANVCLCPRSNMILHNRLPDVSTMIKKGIKPAIGTDSLASNNSLSIFDEMKCIAKKFINISPQQILEMGTINGARALGLENFFGRLTPGRRAKMIYLPIEVTDSKNIVESIINFDFSDKRIEH